MNTPEENLIDWLMCDGWSILESIEVDYSHYNLKLSNTSFDKYSKHSITDRERVVILEEMLSHVDNFTNQLEIKLKQYNKLINSD